MREEFLARVEGANVRRWAQLRPGSQAWDEASGDCVLREIRGPDGQLRRLEVVQADPQVRIAAEIVERVRAGEGAPEVTLAGDLFKIHAANRRVVYRLVRYIPERQAWIAEWPD